ncbi:MAG: hypothetical protein MUC90_06230 [Thermoplasmata archaeon]|nr:hypothetical protein [Thermoplasmata archaeon]
MSSQEPDPALEPPKEPPLEEPPPPPPADELPEGDIPALDEAFKEDYDALVIQDEPVRPKRKKKRKYGGIIVLAVVIFILLAWTLVSPDVMPETGTVYTESTTYSNLGHFIGYRDIWAGNMSWGLCFSGPNTTSVNEVIEIKVLIVKISEEPGNFFFVGTSISLRNVSIFIEDGTYLASMTNLTDLGYGISVTLRFSLDAPGTYVLYLHWKFLVNQMMRIGYIPLEMLTTDPAYPTYLDVPIVVTA